MRSRQMYRLGKKLSVFTRLHRTPDTTARFSFENRAVFLAYPAFYVLAS